jgi:uncharacterized membrane protein
LTDRQQSGLSENLAALLSYVLGWVTGLIFFLLDKRSYVRFHAAQSVIVFLALQILRSAVGAILGVGWWWGGFGGWGLFSLSGLILNLISLASLILWIVLMVKAFQGIRFKVPLAGDIAENLAGDRI